VPEGRTAERAPLGDGALREREDEILEGRPAAGRQGEMEEVAEAAPRPEDYPERRFRSRTTSNTIGSTESTITMATTRWTYEPMFGIARPSR